MQKTKGQILVRAREILRETMERCPQYMDKLLTVHFEVSGRMTNRAGAAYYRTDTVKLSLPFFADPMNFDESLFETVTHELAHLVVGTEDRNGRPHGPQWKLVHRSMGGTGRRCHSLNLAEGYSRRRQTRVEFPCSRCGQTMMLGPTQAKRARMGARYSHRKCPR
jgi:predicted SprT family Zn-dependent metalloprotease